MSQAWRADAVCRQVDHELFFPEHGQHAGNALKVCRRCPVAKQCLDYALDNLHDGIWGGLIPLDRKYYRRKTKGQQ